MTAEQLWESLGVTDEDRAYFAARGKPLADVERELRALTEPQTPPQVEAAARYDNGFLQSLSQRDYETLLSSFEAQTQGKELAIFVPAAGAASRQFQMLKTILHHPALSSAQGVDAILAAAQARRDQLATQEALTEAQKAEDKQLGEVLSHLRRFWEEGIVEGKLAFADAVSRAMEAQGQYWADVIEREQLQAVCQAILAREDGLGYGWLPKALLAFHRYPTPPKMEPDVRTSLEEHIRALLPLRQQARVRLHLAISEEHEEPIAAAREQIAKKLTRELEEAGLTADHIQVDWSFQAASTDAVALDLRTQQLARQPDGAPLMRKAGHGALIENVAALDVDGIWIQNIDNILYQNQAPQMAVLWTKQLMASLAFARQAAIHQRLHQLHAARDAGQIEPAQLQALHDFAVAQLTLKPQSPQLQPDSLAQGHAPQDVIDAWIELLDRPLVVAGYVPLKPEQKGGGPFVLAQRLGDLVVHKTNTVEGAEFEGGQSHPLFQSGICFNPVNLFIATQRYDGSRFSLNAFADEARFFSSQKTDAQGQPIQIYERPGLWNGALAGALQISIGILANTFSAVKDVAGPESFLSPLHQPGQPPIATDLDRQRGIVDDATITWLNDRLSR